MITINWSDWLREISSQLEIPAKIDNFLNLKPLSEASEQQALANYLQRYEERVLFLEEDSRKICAYRWQDKYVIRELPPASSKDSIRFFLNYTLDVAKLLTAEVEKRHSPIYHSLQPLLYTGSYWLNTVCRRELARIEGLEREEKKVFSILLFPVPKVDSVEDLVSELRSSDSVAIFGSYLAVLLPFTPAAETRALCRRIKENFHLASFNIWQYPTDFENIYELKVKVEKRL